MGKKRSSPKAMIQLPIKFNKSVSVSPDSAAMAFSINREESGMPLLLAEEYFCARNLTIEILLGSLKDAKQKKLPGVDGPPTLNADVIIPKFSVGPKKYAASMKFVTDKVHADELREFAGKDAILSIFDVSTADPKAVADPDDQDAATDPEEDANEE